mmetsp:Transcript_19873/g.43446  ORF Transcript_19873/g.43446 Transcript_19873/m.43446 type:complete len:212 (+) Transcript_19873:617-1252(+)
MEPSVVHDDVHEIQHYATLAHQCNDGVPVAQARARVGERASRHIAEASLVHPHPHGVCQDEEKWRLDCSHAEKEGVTELVDDIHHVHGSVLDVIFGKVQLQFNITGWSFGFPHRTLVSEPAVIYHRGRDAFEDVRQEKGAEQVSQLLMAAVGPFPAALEVVFEEGHVEEGREIVHKSKGKHPPGEGVREFRLLLEVTHPREANGDEAPKRI